MGKPFRAKRYGVVDCSTKRLFSTIRHPEKNTSFFKGRSIVLQLLKVLDIWTETLDNGGCIDVIYCDFMKAFDKVSHNRLLKKLEGYELKGNILDWIVPLLAHRTQRVRVNNSYLDWQDVISGISQGSVIGLKLFIIFINDLPNVVNSSYIFLFPDDMKLLYIYVLRMIVQDYS